MKPKIGHQALRKGRYSNVNHIYHVTFTTFNRSPLFSEFLNASILRQVLMASDVDSHTSTLAYCIMPDHIHWLFQLNSGSLSQSVGRVKSLYSKVTSTKCWQRGFYDHAIRSDETLIEVARYIVANPLRAGLVKNVGKYPHWDAIWL